MRTVALMKDYLVNELGIRVITSHLMVGNTAAIPALVDNGFFVQEADAHVLEDWGFSEPTLVDKYVFVAYGS